MVRRGIAIVLLAAAVAGCNALERPTPPQPGAAALEITVVPDPLRILWVCPQADTNCYGSLDPQVTIAETAGVGGRLDSVEFTAREPITGAAIGQQRITSEEIAARAGTNRIEAGGRMIFRPTIEGWPVPSRLPRPRLVVDIVVQLTDDLGNVVRQTKRVDVS